MPSSAPLTQSEIDAVRNIVATRCGFYLGAPHERYLGKQVQERMQELSAEFPGYLRRLSDSPSDGGELQALVERLCIYETRFMRDPPDFRALGSFILPQLGRELRRTGRSRLKVVSAGCSTGQELYSLAMVIDRAQVELGDARVDLIGIDLSAEALDRARRARYGEREVAMLDPWYRERYLRRQGAEYQVVESLRDRVRFLQSNLTHELPVTQVDIIFCRNVLIYFNPVQRQMVIRNLMAALRLGGYLIVGSADSTWAHREYLRTVRTSGTLVFQRVKPLPSPAAPAEAAAGSDSSPHELGMVAT